MRFDIFTLFPEICSAYLQESILKRAQAAGLVSIHLHNIRDYAADRHHVTDDLPYGGGGGMVMKPEPVFNAVESVLEIPNPKFHAPHLQAPIPIILLTPQGRPFTQAVAQELAQHERLALICGRYEGFDERIRAHLATDEISIGDYVLTGGELAALVIVDAVTRLLPGALGDPTGAADDSHASGLLEYPHYTRPPEFRGWAVPEALLSGDHARITRWRREAALRRTFLRRPDMLLKLALSEEEKLFLSRVAEEEANRRKPQIPNPKPPTPQGD
ncbi:MAG TPA: tRNA (guanosine(37)-N1)-methyltransferase TrmD [Anaerolineales bacterium]|nr:tRNA (guanosine(37)-N1)-methyltransferase TrmD [Anaerolineales bacterium]